MLQIRNLGKTITLHILAGAVIQPFSGVSFDVDQGQFVVIAGPSGSGKSSIIKTIHRTYLASEGQALYVAEGGRIIDLATAPDRTIIELRGSEIGFVSQFLKVEPRVPAIDVVARPLVRRGCDRDEARERAAGLLLRLDVPERLWNSYPALFSGGEQQRINIARALVARPRLLLADEPTSALDSTNTGRVVEALLEAREAGMTMVGVFHDIDLIERIADRVVVMGQGRVQAQGRIGEVEIPRLELHQEFAPRV
jgi:alpha-D-ribose 1-methylphosphonate 5-triphosphate synthase subunit PhnL